MLQHGARYRAGADGPVVRRGSDTDYTPLSLSTIQPQPDRLASSNRAGTERQQQQQQHPHLHTPVDNLLPFRREAHRHTRSDNMREIVHLQAGQCGNQIGAKVRKNEGCRQSSG